MEDKNNNSNFELNLLSKDGLLALLRHQSILTMIDNFVRDKVRGQLWNSFCFVFASFLAVGGFYLGWAADAKEGHAAQYHNYIQREDHRIDELVAVKMQWLERCIGAMLDLRQTRMNIVLQCQQHKAPSRLQQDIQRTRARYGVLEAFAGGHHIFNDTIFQKYYGFIAFDNSVADVCAPGAPNDDVWRIHMEDVLTAMEQSIEQDVVQLKKLR